VPLFLDRLPLRERSVRRDTSYWSVSLEVLITDPGLASPPPGARPQRWIFDTGKEGEASCWRCDLEDAGLDTSIGRRAPITSAPAHGPTRTLPTRAADLWLLSNIPALRGRPYRIALPTGIAFQDIPNRRTPQTVVPPLIGMQAFLHAQLRVQIDFPRRRVSIWTPGPWYSGCALFVRRALSGFATLPPPW
jgi:hypothetical protein